MNMERPSGLSRHTRFSLLAALLAVASGAGAAPDTRYMPPPGLYQVEIVSERSVDSPAGTVQDRSTVDAATGAVDTRFRRADGSQGRHTVAGDGAQRVCIRPVKSVEVPKELLGAGCTVGKGQVVGQHMVATNTCPWGQVKTSMRQVDARTWETVVESAIVRAPTGAEAAGGLAFVRSMAEKAAREGNPQERAEAQRALANFKQMEAGMQGMPKAGLPPQAAAAMGGRGTAALQQKVVQRLTRVGDCKG